MSFSSLPAAAPVDLDQCAREPIHLSGAVQPYGCLLVCDLAEWTITHASANVAEILALAPGTQVLGRPADTILTPTVLHDLRNTLQGSMVSGSAERLTGIVAVDGGALMDLAVHASGSGAVLEFTRHGGADTTTIDPIVLIKSMVGRLRRAPTLARYLQLAANQIRSVTGYDRVMIYRFLPDESGQVVAEALRPGLTPYMGLRYPASDIPVQARALYKRQWLRLITDVDYTPVPLQAAPGIGSEPIDLSLATLRSVSPVHLDYLRNMGSAATLTVSLMASDTLWGLISCHHEAPRRISASTCAATELFGQIFSLQVESKEAAEEQTHIEQVREAHDQLIANLPATETLFDNLAEFAPLVQRIVPCDGLGLWADGRFSGYGLVPPVSAMPAIAALLDGVDADMFVSSRLSRELPLAATFADRVSGMVAIRFTRATQDYLLLFRRELVQTVVWGGNPNKPVEMKAGSLLIGPRRSFEAWRERVRGESAPWRPAEVQILRTLRVSMLDVILRQTDLVNRERKAAQESQSLLIAELNHRVKNVLALIRSLVRQSRQNATDVDSFTADLEHRIRALAFAHDQLTEVGWRGAPLRRLLEAEVEAWAGAASARVVLTGPNVTLGSRGYQALALVFHEMMTNAAKYGALSRNEGRLAVVWRLAADGPLVIEWTETGGPPVASPERRGFGSVIIDQTIPFELHGESHVDYAASGVTGHFVIPAAHLLDCEADGAAAATGIVPAEPVADLRGKRLLLVEDSMMIALDAQGMLNESGLEVEIAGNVADANRALMVNTFDGAVLDVNLSGETSFPVADALAAAGIPFVFATGYGESITVPERFAGTAVVAKPYDEKGLRRALSGAFA